MRTIIFFLFFATRIISCYAQKENLALNKPVMANSENPAYPVENVVDGKISRNSKWMSADVKPPHILQVDLQKYCDIDQIIIHTGIPENERTPSESLQAAGFWSAKNFKLQYWDDANWTDIPNTEVHENRLTTVNFQFPVSINTYKLRLVCDDGEPISIMEFQVFGKETDLAVPSIHSDSLEKNTRHTKDRKILLTIDTIQSGKSMKYVGYNQGYYMPGSNTSGWIEYSGVNSVRIWTSLNTYVPLSAVQVDKTVRSVDEFDKRKAELRSNPENNPFVHWNILLPIYNGSKESNDTNHMVLDYVLAELKRLQIDPLLQAGSTDFDATWSNKWQQWQRYYALAFYAAKTGDVTMYAMQNEPNHRNSGMKLDQWISGMQIVSDAFTCAIKDVNKKYGKKLTARMVGPVTSGNNPEWWAAIAKAIRTDYHGKTIDYDLIKIFSTHSYNSPAAGYLHRVEDIRKIIKDNHPLGKSLPIVYTEIGRWMNAYLIDKKETMDSPSLFTEWAGMYTNNTLNQASGMWAFKFSNTASGSYNRGIKSGHHFTWQGKRIVEDAYKNLLAGKQVTSYNNTSAAMITDDLKTDESSWKSDSTIGKKWLEIDMGKIQSLGSAVVYTGSAGGIYTAPDRIIDFTLQYMDNRQWHDIPGAIVKNNKYAQLFITFEQPVSTNKIRFITDMPGVVKIREIKAFGANDGPSKDQKNYNVSGIQRTGEVVRLFARGFKNERPLLKTTEDVKDDNLDALMSFDAHGSNYYLWLVQRGMYTDSLTIDLTRLPVSPGSIAVAESVGPASYGEVSGIFPLHDSKRIILSLPPQTVMLLTIPRGNLQKETLGAASDACVSGGKNAGKNYDEPKHVRQINLSGMSATENSMRREIRDSAREGELKISLDASNPDHNYVSYISFDLSDSMITASKRILLKVTGRNATDRSLVRFHVYGIPSKNWDEKKLTWLNSPNLDSHEALITEVGQTAFVAGELAMDDIKRDHYLDVSDLFKRHYSGKSLTFVLVRETRQLGDDIDKGKTIAIDSRESENGPQLELWLNSTDE